MWWEPPLFLRRNPSYSTALTHSRAVQLRKGAISILEDDPEGNRCLFEDLGIFFRDGLAVFGQCF
jgi:hypothetical protein